MASSDNPSRALPAGSSPAAGDTAAAGIATPMPSLRPGGEGESLWPYVGLALIALVLAILWKKNGGLRFLPKWTAEAAPGHPPRKAPDRHA